jgi:hypothetical protein
MQHAGMGAGTAMTHTMPMTGTMPADHAMQHAGMGASAAMTHTMPMTGTMPADHAMHHAGMDASAAMTHTMPMTGTMAGGMDHSQHTPARAPEHSAGASVALMMNDMEAMMQRMVEMHSSMAMTHTMPMTGTMDMAGMTHEQHMGRMMIMMGQMMQMMGEMHMMGGMSGMDHGAMGGDMSGMDHGAMGGGMSGMCDMMGGQGCDMMGQMDQGAMSGGMSGMDHGAMGGGMSGMCDMMGGQGCDMMGQMDQGAMSGGMSGMDHGAMGGGMSGMCDMMGGQGCDMMGSMGAGSSITATQTLTATLAEAAAAPLGTPDTRTSQSGASAVSVTPLNLTDPQAATLDFALSWQDQAAHAGIDLAALATLRAGTQQLAASGWQPETGVLSFPATDLSGVNTVTLVLRNVAEAPLRTFTWMLRR